MACNLKRQKHSQIVAGALGVRRKLGMIDALISAGKLCPKQNDHPAQLQPGQKEGQDREAAVNRIVLDRIDLKGDVVVPEKVAFCLSSNRHGSSLTILIARGGKKQPIKNEQKESSEELSHVVTAAGEHRVDAITLFTL